MNLMLSTKGWREKGIFVEGEQVEIDGVNIWPALNGVTTKACEKLPHPQYPKQMHDFAVYSMEGKTMGIEIAVCEVSACAYAIYYKIHEPAQSL